MARSATPRSTQVAGLRRRPHTKSRFGCRNCKLRRVKCDETKPLCSACISFGVKCNYNPAIADLQAAVGEISVVATPFLKPIENTAHLVLQQINSIICSASSSLPPLCSTTTLEKRDLYWLHEFHSNTVLTIGMQDTREKFQHVFCSLAGAHLVVTHAVLGIAARHWRLSVSPEKGESVFEAYHVHQATSLLKEKLAQPPTGSDRDALWAAVALLGVLAFSSIDFACPEAAWPMSEHRSDNLQWLKICTGKRAVWEIVNPLRADSVFRTACAKHEKLNESIRDAIGEQTQIPLPFVKLFELEDGMSSDKPNPYKDPVQIILYLMGLEKSVANTIHALYFVGAVNQEYMDLLEAKDPRALLLLGYWYAINGNSNWWIRHRCLIEGRSICMYLARYHPQDDLIQELLVYPRIMLDLPDPILGKPPKFNAELDDLSQAWRETQSFEEVISALRLPRS